MLPGHAPGAAAAPRPARSVGVRHHRLVPAAPPAQSTEVCPGCGAVLVAPESQAPTRAGASASCVRLFEVTLRSLREEAGTDASCAAVMQRADAAYDAQHPTSADPQRLRAALESLGAEMGGPVPAQWTTTIADVAADLDVIDLTTLVDAWARAVREDWAAVGAPRP